MNTIFGIVKELKTDETRVSLTPDCVAMLTNEGYEVLIEQDAGTLSGFSDEQYIQSGAKIASSNKEVWEKANVIVKVKEPQKAEYQYFRENQVIFSYMHLAVEEELTRELLNKKVCAIASESVTDTDGGFPILRPMSEVAGRLSIQLGANYLESINGGSGVLLGGVPGVQPGKVVIIGGGIVGTNAAKVALGMGADVSVLDINSKRLADLDMLFKGSLKTHYCNPYTIKEECKKADILVGAVLLPGRKAPKLVNANVVEKKKKGSFIIDVAIDQGGNIETMDKITTLKNPVFEKFGVLHCAVPNLPSLTPRTSSFAYSYAILPYIQKIGKLGVIPALKEDEFLRAGVNTFKGEVTSECLAETFNLRHTEITLLIGFKVL